MTKKTTPEIDKTAEILDPVEAAPTADSADVAMPTAENESTFVFRASKGISTLDVMEIALMRWIALTGSNVDIAPGALRTIVLPGFRVDQLSPEARKHMFEVPDEVVPAPGAPSAPPITH